MPNSRCIYPKYRPSGNAVVDSDEVLEAYNRSGEENKLASNHRVTEERTERKTTNVQRDPPTTSKKTPTYSSKMTTTGKSKQGFLPIAMPRPDPPDEVDGMSRSSSHFSAPPHIEVRSSSELVDDVATDVSDMTYTTEFVSEGLAFGEKGSSKSPLKKYQALLQEKKNKRASFSKRLNIVAEERESAASTSERNVEHIDVTNLDKVDPPVAPIDVTALEDVQETIDLVGQEVEPPMIIDATSFGEPIYQHSADISEAKRELALREAKGRLLIKKTARQEPPSGDDAPTGSTTGLPTPRAKKIEADRPQKEPVETKSPDPQSSSELSSKNSATSSPTAKKSVPSLLSKTLKAARARRAGPRKAAANIVASPRPASPKATTLSEVSKGAQNNTNNNNPATLMLKETVSAEGSVVIDTTNIDEDDIDVVEMLNSNAKNGEAKKTVFSFVSNRSKPGVLTPAVAASEAIPVGAIDPEGIASNEWDEAPPEGATDPEGVRDAAVAPDATATEAREPQQEESHFKEFVMFTAGCIQSFALQVNSTVQEKIKEIPPMPPMPPMPNIDLISDNDMDGMLGALEKGMSERNFIVPTEDEEREMLSSFLEEHITQPVCGMDQPSCGGSSTDKSQVDTLIGSVAKTYQNSFVNCGVEEPQTTTQKKSKLLDDVNTKEFVVPVNYERRGRSRQKE